MIPGVNAIAVAALSTLFQSVVAERDAIPVYLAPLPMVPGACAVAASVGQARGSGSAVNGVLVYLAPMPMIPGAGVISASVGSASVAASASFTIGVTTTQTIGEQDLAMTGTDTDWTSLTNPFSLIEGGSFCSIVSYTNISATSATLRVNVSSLSGTITIQDTTTTDTDSILASAKTTITVDHTKVVSGNASKRVLISESTFTLRHTSYGGLVRSLNGHDIRFFEDENALTSLTWEIEKYDPASGELVAWVNLGSALSDSVDDEFYMFFGDASITTFQGGQIWDVNYKSVHHLAEKTSEWVRPDRPVTPNVILHGGTGYKGSQVNDPVVITDPNDSTKLVMFFNAGDADPIATRVFSIGRATANKVGFSASSTWTEYIGNPILSPGGSVGGRRPDSAIVVGTTIYLFTTAFTASGNECHLFTSTDSGISFSGPTVVLTLTGQGRNDGGYIGNFSVMKEDSTWYMVYTAATTGDPFTSRKRYASSANGTSWTKSGGDLINCGPSGSPDYFGLEWSHLLKIGSYYILLYEAAISESVFFGPDPTIYSLNVAYAFSPSGPWIKSGANPVWQRSAVAGRFDESHVATGAFYEINGSWYMFYCGGTDPEQDVFDLACVSVDNPTTTFLPGLTDSSTYGFHLVPSGPTEVSGQINGALSFDADYAGCITPPLLSVNNFMGEAWVKLSSLSQDGIFVHFGMDNTVNGGNGYGVGVGNGAGGNGAKLVVLVDTVGWIDSGYTFTDTNWHKVVWIRSGGTWEFWVDDVQTSNTSDTSTPTVPQEYFRIGASGPGPARTFEGTVDEVCISAIVRTEATRTTEYNSESDPAFYSATYAPSSITAARSKTMGTDSILLGSLVT